MKGRGQGDSQGEEMVGQKGVSTEAMREEGEGRGEGGETQTFQLGI